jgi:hypothetical protein
MALFKLVNADKLSGALAQAQQQLHQTRAALTAERKAHENTRDELATVVSERDGLRQQVERTRIPNPHMDNERHFKTGCAYCLMNGHNPGTDFRAIWEPS